MTDEPNKEIDQQMPQDEPQTDVVEAEQLQPEITDGDAESHIDEETQAQQDNENYREEQPDESEQVEEDCDDDQQGDDEDEDTQESEADGEDCDEALDEESSDDDDEPLVPQSQESITAAAAEEIACTVESILFASGSPLTQAKLASIAEVPGASVRKAIERLNERYESSDCCFRVEKIAGGYQLMSLPEYNDVLKRLLNVKKESRLSQPAMETLAIVAYRQPILRADIESIRGVACGEVLRSLMERQLVKIVGRAEVIGRPMLYGTTKKFLEIFGLGSLEDLPRAEELREPAEKPKKKKPKDEETKADDQQDAEADADENEEAVVDAAAAVAAGAMAGVAEDVDGDDEIVEEFEADEEITEDDEFDDEDEFDEDDDEFDEDDEEFDDDED